MDQIANQEKTLDEKLVLLKESLATDEVYQMYLKGLKEKGINVDFMESLLTLSSSDLLTLRSSLSGMLEIVAKKKLEMQPKSKVLFRG